MGFRKKHIQSNPSLKTHFTAPLMSAISAFEKVDWSSAFRVSLLKVIMQCAEWSFVMNHRISTSQSLFVVLLPDVPPIGSFSNFF